MAGRHRRQYDSDVELGFGCIMGVLMLIAMPIVGFFMMFSKDESTSSTGKMMLIIGIIIWVVIGIMNM